MANLVTHFNAQGWPIMVRQRSRMGKLDKSLYPGAYDFPAQGMGDAVEDAQAGLKKAVITAAVETASLQTGISVGLMFVIPLGSAISALMSVVQVFSGRYNAKKLNDSINNWKTKLQLLQQSYQDKSNAAQQQAAEEEYPASTTLALSNQPLDDQSPAAVDATVGNMELAAQDGVPLSPSTAPVEEIPATAVPVGVDGLGNLWAIMPPRAVRFDLGPAGMSGEETDLRLRDGLAGWWGDNVSAPLGKLNRKVLALPIIKKLVTPVVKKIAQVNARVVAEVLIRPVQLVGRVILRSGSIVLRATGNKKQSEQWRNMDNQWARRTDWAIRRNASTLASFQQFKADARNAFRIMTGASTLDAVDSKMQDIYNKTWEQWEANYQFMLQRLNSPQGRAEIRLQLARGIRNDPTLLDQARALAAKNAQLFALANAGVPDESSIKQTQSLGVLAPLAAIGAAGALMFLHH